MVVVVVVAVARWQGGGGLGGGVVVMVVVVVVAVCGHHSQIIAVILFHGFAYGCNLDYDRCDYFTGDVALLFLPIHPSSSIAQITTTS